MNEILFKEHIRRLKEFASEQLRKEWNRASDYSACISLIEKSEELDMQELKKELIIRLCEDEEGRNIWRSYRRISELEKQADTYEDEIN